MYLYSTTFFIFGYCIVPYVSQITLPNQPIKDALFLHNVVSSNLTLRDCVFRPTSDKITCPDPDLRYILYTNGEKQVVDYLQTDWLRQSIWDSTKEDILLIHGYAGGDDALPMVVLRDAYSKNSSYNVWVVDWGNLSPPPCYRAAVNNMKAVARCTGDLITSLRAAGLPTEKLTCVGHSLGAHICGLISESVVFRMHRVVGLDPARPLVPPSSRLTSGAANAVHVLHTNAGHYGEGGRGGHVNFCINGGRTQPYCENADIDIQLCSHVWAICYMAESLFPELTKKAEPCSRRCPSGPRPGNRMGIPVIMGQGTPLSASGSFCYQDKYPPFCPTKQGGIGDKRCCLQAPEIVPSSSAEAISGAPTTPSLF
ncbi:unnamed protein product [Acanthoscelides obtectus]|uniref:Lipase domain-containing protein n=2 Tax=Acanthoscelides obtectus TaxID=200917 RepID=A0A9P0LIG8_ACAOB|nr:unnamed protein product [Acanthoscelides obtectus]CAK1624505.1 Lipase member H [Acanthoscelides obtectus]